MSTKLRRQIETAVHLNNRQKDSLIEKLESIAYEERLCHGDFHIYNVIIANNDGMTILDWIDASVGDSRADIYRTYLLYLQRSTEMAETYLRLYCAKSDLSSEEIFQWAPIVAGARLSEDVPTENQERLLAIGGQYCAM